MIFKYYLLYYKNVAEKMTGLHIILGHIHWTDVTIIEMRLMLEKENISLLVFSTR